MKRTLLHCDAPGCGKVRESGATPPPGWWELQVTSWIPCAGVQSGEIDCTHYVHACSAEHAKAVWADVVRQTEEARAVGEASQAEVRARYETP